jgi:hypothetical protein
LQANYLEMSKRTQVLEEKLRKVEKNWITKLPIFFNLFCIYVLCEISGNINENYLNVCEFIINEQYASMYVLYATSFIFILIRWSLKGLRPSIYT